MKIVIITSAVALTATQKKALLAAVEEKYGKDLSVEEVIDPRVIGGVKLTVNAEQIDATVAGKLQQLQSQLS